MRLGLGAASAQVKLPTTMKLSYPQSPSKEIGASLKHFFLFKSYNIEGYDVVAEFQTVGEIRRTS
jgi:hypothetical protein